MKRDTIAILSLVAVFAIQGCLTIGAIVVDMEPAFVPMQLRILKAALAAFNIGGGLAIAFYFQAKYGDSWPLVIAGVVLFGACYFGYYGGWEQMKEWIGKGYGLLLAIYDTLLIRRGMECVSIGQKETNAKTEAQTEHAWQMELAEAGTRKAEADALTAKANEGIATQQRMTAEVRKETKAMTISNNAGKETGKPSKVVKFPTRDEDKRSAVRRIMADRGVSERTAYRIFDREVAKT